MLTFASDTSLPRHTSTSWYDWLGRCGGSVFWLLRTILGIVAETATVSSRTLAFFLSTGNRYLFLLQRQWFPFDSLPRLQIQFSCVWHQSFVNGVSDLFNSSPWSSNFELGTDVFSWISMSDSRILNLHRRSKISSDGIVIDNRTSCHLVSNSWSLSSRRVTENKSAWSRTVSWAPVTRK